LTVPVEDVGKMGQVVRVAGQISNLPVLHRQVLEKLARGQAAPCHALRKLFHFSCLNYGGYCLSNSLNTGFPKEPVARERRM
jgi:hypothetical protein